MPTIILILFVLAAAALFPLVILTRRGTVWGSTPAERAATLAGDAFFGEKHPYNLKMTRAISIHASPTVVWPWLAQIGRGAGWYSYDRLDNGGKPSARHIVTWIPEPCVGDTAAIGCLRHIDSGRELAWWADGEQWLGSMTRMATDFYLTPAGTGSRLVVRVSGDAIGPTAPLLMGIFALIDSIMARRQLVGIKARAEQHGARRDNPDAPETGAHDQYQLYEVIYAPGDKAGVPGQEHAAYWRQKAIKDGVLTDSSPR
jgi:hypothetical protein